METLNYVSIYKPKEARPIKRLGAFLLDTILVLVLFTGILYLLAITFKYDNIKEQLDQIYINFNVYRLNGEGVYEFCSTQSDETCKQAFISLYQDQNFLNTYSKLQNCLIYGPIISMFISLLVVEFIFPLIFKNGQTIGMKALNIALLSDKEIKVKNVQVFIRFLFGKFIFVGLIPILSILFVLFSSSQLYGYIMLLIDLIVNIICYASNNKHSFLPDKISRCFVVDKQEQMFFDTIEQLNLAKGKEANIYNKH